MEKVLIITGGSRGIGLGVIQAYLKENYRIFSLARTSNAFLTANGVSQITCNLTETYEIETVFNEIFSLINKDKVSHITFINNAGALGKIGPVVKQSVGDIEEAFKLNAIVPFVCSAIFIKLTSGWTAKKYILNISSGAAEKPYFGWGTYCSTKAAVNMLTQTLAVEQAEEPNGVKVLAIAPGVVDTGMQTQIRSAAKADFKDLDRFVSLKNEGNLFDASYVGEQILAFNKNENIATGSILRVT